MNVQLLKHMLEISLVLKIKIELSLKKEFNKYETYQSIIH